MFKLLLILFTFQLIPYNGMSQSGIQLKKEIRGSISPKSIVSSGSGLFSAQNMMYKHTVTLYNAKGDLLTTIKDKIKLKNYGFTEYLAEAYTGGPVEACFSEKGKYLWVSQYSMLGTGFNKEGCDACIGSHYDPSFVYKINTTNYKVENIIKVGAVPKYLAINELTKKMVVTNWTSSDVSIIDLTTEKEIKRIKVGAHPRGVVLTKNGDFCFVTIMGSTKIAKINMKTYAITYINNIGKSPRHLVLDVNDEYLYCSVNSANKIVKINLATNQHISCITKAGPRTMILSENQKYLYVVNYFTDSFQKIDASTMTVIETIKTGHHPIGITGNWLTSEIWVACYAGKIQIFKDNDLEKYNNDLFASSKVTPLKPKIKLIPINNLGVYFDEDIKSKIKEDEIAALKQKEFEQQQLENKKIAIQQEKERVLLAEKKRLEAQQKANIIAQQKAKAIQLEKEQKAKILAEQKAKALAQKNKDNKPATSNCKYHLIIGSFSVASNATGLQKKMKAKGYNAQLIPSKNKKMTMVSIQCYSTSAQMSKAKAQILKDSQQKGWVFVQ